MIGARVNAALLSSVLGTVVPPRVDECVTTGILVPDGTACGSGTSWSGWRSRHRSRRTASAELHARLLAELEQRGECRPGAARPPRGRLPATGRRCCGTRPRRRGGRPRWARTARRPPSTSGRCGSPAICEPAGPGATARGLAGEYALLDRWEEAERALRAALELRREIGDQRNVGENLHRLSTTLWRLCRGAEAAEAAVEAVRVLQSLPRGLELAWAYAGLGASS